MTIQDFSSGFDTLLNSYAVRVIESGGTDNPATIELDEYEKSLLLTKSQQEIAIELYNGRNPLGESFEETEQLRRYLATLVIEAKPEMITNSSGTHIGMEGSNSYFFTLPDNVMFITYESVKLSEEEDDKCKTPKTLEVKPVRQDEYHKIRQNPFRGANDRRALRLDLADGVIEIICKYNVAEYYIRYVRKVKPIILVDLDEDQSIEGEREEQGSELPDFLHQYILDRAVQLAIQSRGYTNTNNK